MQIRYKPVGWRNEPYQHYLAAKGIKTGYFAKSVPSQSLLNNAKFMREQELAMKIMEEEEHASGHVPHSEHVRLAKERMAREATALTASEGKDEYIRIKIPIKKSTIRKIEKKIGQTGREIGQTGRELGASLQAAGQQFKEEYAEPVGEKVGEVEALLKARVGEELHDYRVDRLQKEYADAVRDEVAFNAKLADESLRLDSEFIAPAYKEKVIRDLADEEGAIQNRKEALERQLKVEERPYSEEESEVAGAISDIDAARARQLRLLG
jgi:hypothetical protein